MYIVLGLHQDAIGHWADETIGPLPTVVVSQPLYAVVSDEMGKTGSLCLERAVML